MRRVIEGCVISVLLIGCDNADSDAVFRGETESHGSSSGEPQTTGTSEDTGGDDEEDSGDKEETGDLGEGGETGETEGCTRTQGYWKNHSANETKPNRQIAWPIAEDTDLCGTSWYDWLHSPSHGDAFVILARQWIAASLNGAAGVTVPADVQTAIDDAGALLAGCSISDADRGTALDLATTLDDYNNGALGVEHCE